MNGGVYVQFQGEFCPVSGGGLRIDAGRSLALRVLRVQGSGRFYAYYEARATESVKLVLEVNFMQRQKLLARRKLVAEPAGSGSAMWVRTRSRPGPRTSTAH